MDGGKRGQATGHVPPVCVGSQDIAERGAGSVHVGGGGRRQREETAGERAHGSGCQESRPFQSPRDGSGIAEMWGACLLVLGQVIDEGNGFVVPAPTDLKSKDDDAGATCAQQFWVRPFFGKAG